MLTDLVEIRRQGILKSAENLQFRRYLAARHQRVETFQSIARQMQAAIDCTQCANCCRDSIVTLRGAEVARIAAYLGLDEHRVVERFTTRDPDSPKARVLASGQDGCIFLEGNRCSLYPARPEACRNFPHVAPGTHSLGGRMESMCRWVPLCPVLYNAFEKYKHLVGFTDRERKDSDGCGPGDAPGAALRSRCRES